MWKKSKCKDYYWRLINNISHSRKEISAWENIYTNFKNKDDSFGKRQNAYSEPVNK